MIADMRRQGMAMGEPDTELTGRDEEPGEARLSPDTAEVAVLLEESPDVTGGDENRRRKEELKNKLFGSSAAINETPDGAYQVGSLDSTEVALSAGLEQSEPLRAAVAVSHDSVLRDMKSGYILAGQYQLIRQLGRGGMGAVFLAQDTRLNRHVAIKLLSSDNPEVCRRFMAEARATARCKHENIVGIHDVGEFDGRPYMVLEHVEGVSLRDWMKKRAVGSRELAIEIMIPVARALAHAHGHGLVHRDLKPENIMLGRDGSLKVLDFGIAKVVGQQARLQAAGQRARQRAEATSSGDSTLQSDDDFHTRKGALLGTAPYMSPEQWNAEEVDPRADIWAVGIMLWELGIAAHPLAPFTRKRLLDIADSRVPMPSARQAHPELGALAGLIDRCLCKDKSQRLSSAGELLGELRALLPEGSSAPAKRAARSPWPLAALAVIAAAAAIALSVWPTTTEAPADSSAAPAASTWPGWVRIPGARFAAGSSQPEILAAVARCMDELRGEPASACDRSYFERELNTRQLAVSPFDIQETEVTNGDYARWLNRRFNDHGHHPARESKVRDRDGALLLDLAPGGSGLSYAQSLGRFVPRGDRDDLPVIYVTWFGAQRYCESLEARLPTEIEWELAARGAERRAHPWGDASPACTEVVVARDARYRQRCNPAGDLALGPQPVTTSGTGDITPLGARGLGGNVSEWVLDRFELDLGIAEPCGDFSSDQNEGECGFRGGSWASQPILSRGATRMKARPGSARPDIGFRCVKEVSPNDPS